MNISLLFLRKIKDQHFEEFHAKTMCDCGKEYEKRFIENHKVFIKNKNNLNH